MKKLGDEGKRRDVGAVKYVIRSLSEGNLDRALGKSAFWSIDNGWGSLERANRFSTLERMQISLPLSTGGDAEWMLYDEALNLSRKPVEALVMVKRWRGGTAANLGFTATTAARVLAQKQRDQPEFIWSIEPHPHGDVRVECRGRYELVAYKRKVRRVRFFDIKWDCDGEEVSLPSAVEIEIDDPRIDIALEGADLLSDRYGYCVESLQFEEIAEPGLRDVWFWLVEGRFGRREGEVRAVDPRDAVSRALTSKTDDGRLIGDALRVPMTFLTEAPGNAETEFRHEEDGIMLTVRKQRPFSQNPLNTGVSEERDRV